MCVNCNNCTYNNIFYSICLNSLNIYKITHRQYFIRNFYYTLLLITFLIIISETLVKK